MKTKIILSFLCLSIIHIYSANEKFHSINTDYGISMRETSSICSDNLGFIWTSSKTGVLRISDGDARIYQLPYRTADVINVKLVIQNNVLYAYSNNGQLFLYDEILDKFIMKADLRQLLNNNYFLVHEMLFDENGFLWIASSSGLYHYKDDKCKLISAESVDCKSLVKLDKNHLCYFYLNKIVRINTDTYKTNIIYKDSKLKTIHLSELFYDNEKSRLWIGTVSEGLYYFDLRNKILNKAPISNFPGQPIQAIEVNNKESILVGIDGQGVWELNRDGSRVLKIFKEDVDNPQSLQGDGVYDIYCDENKRVWVATYSGGLSYYDQRIPLIERIDHQMNVHNSLSNNNVNKVIEDKKGNLWFATDNGLSRWDRSTNSWKSFYQNKQNQAQVFLALAEDNSGNIWAGTYSSGVYVLNAETGQEIKRYRQGGSGDGFSGNFIFDIFKDSDGDMWIGGVQGDLFFYNNKTKVFKKCTPQPVKAIVELTPGKLLLACTYGLLSYDKATNSMEILFQGYTLHDVFVDDRYIWVATSGDGLLRYNMKSKDIKKITTDDGLPSNYINSVMSSEGVIWLGTENGLCRLTPGEDDKIKISTFYSLSNIAFNVGAKYKLANGNLMFGSSRGAVIFDPDKLNDASQEGHIFLQDIKVSGRSIREISNFELKSPLNNQESIKLKYFQNTLELELLPLGVNSAEYKFSWKMKGLDKEWSALSNHKLITYTNLPSGSYDLQIRMYDNSLTTIIDERVIHIRIIPPFWQAWWFRLFLFVAAMAIVYFSLKYYANKLKQEHNEDKIRFFATTAHEIRTSLTLISAPIEELSNEKQLSAKGSYFLNLAKEQTGRMLFVATQLLDFQKVDIGKGQVFLVMVDVVKLVQRRISMFETTASKMGLTLEFKSNQTSYLTAVDELKIEKVIDNLISNAIKYSHQNGKIEIRLTADDENWIVEVKDFGLGISENAQKKLFKEFYRGDNVINSKIVGSGIGLLLVKNYVSMHEGEVVLKSKENEGTEFRITIPYRKVDETVEELERPLQQAQPIHQSFVDVELAELTTTGSVSEKKLHLLVVEDNSDLREFLKNSFDELYKVSTANDGKEAWEIIQKKAPDLIVSDIMMPNMNGFDLCKLIKSTFETSHIPVILLTSLDERSKQLEGLGLGADDYITKPFDVSILKQRIISIIKNRDIVRDKVLKLFNQTDQEVPILSNEQNDQFVKKALKVVRENIANSEFGKDEFASAMNASPSLLYKKIKALTGQSPIDFIKKIRLDHSLELLQSRKYSITEVSEQCGFSSVGYFSTVFKKHFDKTPSEIIS